MFGKSRGIKNTVIKGLNKIKSWRMLSSLKSRKDIILVYHAVGRSNKKGYYGNISVDRFEKHIKFFSERSNVVCHKDLVESSKNQRTVITFDDGLRCFYKAAAPILSKYECPATVFINPGLVGDKRKNVIKSRLGVKDEKRIMMNSKEIDEVSRSKMFRLGNHTLTHKPLDNIKSKKEIKKQVWLSKNILEKKFDTEIDAFSFPYGSYDRESLKFVKKSHEMSMGKSGFLLSAKEEKHLMPRCDGHKNLIEVEYEKSYTSHILGKVISRIKN